MVSAANPLPVTGVAGGGSGGSQNYPLIDTGVPAGTATTPIAGGGYNLNLSGSLGGATVSLVQTVNGQDSVVATYTAAIDSLVPPCFTIAQGTIERLTVTGGSPSGLKATLAGVGSSCGLSTAITNSFFGARLQDVSGNPFGTSGNPISVSIAGSSGGTLGDVGIKGYYNGGTISTNSFTTGLNYPAVGKTGGLYATLIGENGTQGVGTGTAADGLAGSQSGLTVNGRLMCFDDVTSQWKSGRVVRSTNAAAGTGTCAAAPPAEPGIVALSTSIVSRAAGIYYGVQAENVGTASGYVAIVDAGSLTSGTALTTGASGNLKWFRPIAAAGNGSGLNSWGWNFTTPLPVSTGGQLICTTSLVTYTPGNMSCNLAPQAN